MHYIQTRCTLQYDNIMILLVFFTYEVMNMMKRILTLRIQLGCHA